MTYLKLTNLNINLENGLRRFCDKNEYDLVVAEVLDRKGNVSHKKALVALKDVDDEDVEEAIIVTTTIDNAYPDNDFDCDAYNSLAVQMAPELIHPNGVCYW